jgi:hypothetical protein
MISEDDEDVLMLLAKRAAAVRLRDCTWYAAAAPNSGILTVQMGSSIDTILTGPVSADSEHGIISDAAWTWVRRSLRGELLSFALVRGTHLIVDDRTQLASGSVVDCAVGRPEHDGWHVDLQWQDRSEMRCTSSGEPSDKRCVASAE